MNARLPQPRTFVTALAVAVLIAATATRTSTVRRAQEFEVARVFLELNDTDGDLGFHGVIDGDEWTSLGIVAPGDKRLLNVVTRTALRQQGLTEIDFESAEPPFDELPVADFLARFPEGVYRIEASAQEGGTIAGRSRLSHVLAAPVSNITVNGQPVPESCDAGRLEVVTELAASEHRVWGDGSRLMQIFWNLLRNSVKFTPEGGTIVVRTWNEDDDGGNTLVVEITDGNAHYYRGAFFYELCKDTAIRLAFIMAQELKRHGIAAVSLKIGRASCRERVFRAV